MVKTSQNWALEFLKNNHMDSMSGVISDVTFFITKCYINFPIGFAKKSLACLLYLLQPKTKKSGAHS